jgi:hypothetical protein
MRKLCYFLTWAYVFTLPCDHSLYFEGLGPISRVVTLTAIPFIAVAIAAHGKIRRIKAFHVLTIMFFAMMASTFYWTLDSDATLTSIRTYMQIMIGVWLVWELAADPESVRKLSVAYMMGAYVSIVNTMREFAMNAGGSVNPQERFNADGWDQNDLAVVLALGILISRCAARGASWPVRLLAFAYIPLALITVALTGSRGGSIVATIAVLALIFQWKGRISPKLAALGILALATYVGLTYVPDSTLDRVLTMTSDFDDMNSRVPIWRAAITVVPSHLLLGAGAGSFPIASGTGTVAHNTFLSVMIEEGFVGIALLLTIVGLLFQSLRRGRSTTSSLWMAILVCWCVGVSSLTWEQTRLTWIIFALVAAQEQAEPEFVALPSLRIPSLRSLRGI